MMYTYRDLIEHLMTAHGGGGIAAEQSVIRAAIQEAVQSVQKVFDWRYYHGAHRIRTSPAVQGTCAYNASTRVATIDSGVWPGWAVYGFLELENRHCEVEARLSSTEIRLRDNLAPNKDFASGTAFRLVRQIYPLPREVVRVKGVFGQGAVYRHRPFPEWLRLKTAGYSPGLWFWTLGRDASVPDRLVVLVHGEPLGSEVLDVAVVRRPRDLVLDGFTRYCSDDGSAVNSTSETTVTFTGTRLQPHVVGAVIRLAMPGATAPPSALGTVGQYSEERMIVDYVSATQVVVNEPWTTGKPSDNGHYVISDPIDVASYMYSAVKLSAEASLARLLKNTQMYAALVQVANSEILLARAADNVAVPNGEGYYALDDAPYAVQL